MLQVSLNDAKAHALNHTTALASCQNKRKE